MWLINVETLELEEFLNETRPQYAILSHTWGDKETTFSKFVESVHVARSDRKIFNTCSLTKNHGLKYAWIDTCCIDKRSSAELTEAINSMFRWYEDAIVCFVYLEDVLPSTSIAEGIRDCRWRTRGWTLQELIAPTKIVFFDSEWQPIGTKADLLKHLVDYTRIPVKVLTKDHPLALYEAASKMAWASERHTSRTEDLAYCLMGIFDVNMPLLYGEGKKAFQRLQQEILAKRPEISLLLWQGWTDSGIDLEKYKWELSTHEERQSLTSIGFHLDLQSSFSPVLAECPRDFCIADSDVRIVIDEAVDVSLTQQNLVMHNDAGKLHIMECGLSTVSQPMQYWLDVRGIMRTKMLNENAKIWLPLRKIAPSTFAIEGRRNFMPSTEGLVSVSGMTKMCLVRRPGVHTIARAIDARTFGIRISTQLLPGFYISAVRPKSHWDPTEQIFFPGTQGRGNEAVFAITLQSVTADEQKLVILCDPDCSVAKSCKVARVSRSEHYQPVLECSPSLHRVVFSLFADRGMAWDVFVTRFPEVLNWKGSSYIEMGNNGEQRQSFSARLRPAEMVSFGKKIDIFELTLELDEDCKVCCSNQHTKVFECLYPIAQ